MSRLKRAIPVIVALFLWIILLGVFALFAASAWGFP